MHSRLIAVGAMVIGALVGACSAGEARLVSIDGKSVLVVPADLEAQSRVIGLGRADTDETSSSILLVLPGSELGLHLANRPTILIYDSRSASPIQKPNLARFVVRPIENELLRATEESGLGLTELILEAGTGEVIADCPVAMKGTPNPICNLSPIAVGPFTATSSIAEADLGRYRVVRNAIASWLSARIRAASGP